MSLTEEFLVSKARQISKELGEPDWLREMRERSARLFFKLDMPEHARHVKVDFESLEYFSPAEKAEKLEELPQEIRETLEALGIPEEEMEMLAGMQVQVDSSIVYQTFSDQLKSLGVIAMPID
ncbi:MAG: Fe-S cluster assembly protein SufB, partial [Candidatus Korarchaeota archaeon]|nr:Fe-S cluster assembly protein SufB [Candidatus Korarchaeota archaeon]